MPVRVTVARGGWQRPLDDACEVRVWDRRTHVLLAVLPGTLVERLLAHYVAGSDLQRQVNAVLGLPTVTLPPRPHEAPPPDRPLRGRRRTP